MEWLPQAEHEFAKKMASYNARQRLYEAQKDQRSNIQRNEAGAVNPGSNGISLGNVEGLSEKTTTRNRQREVKQPKYKPVQHMFPGEDLGILDLAACFKIFFARSLRDSDIDVAIKYAETYLERFSQVSRLFFLCTASLAYCVSA